MVLCRDKEGLSTRGPTWATISVSVTYTLPTHRWDSGWLWREVRRSLLQTPIANSTEKCDQCQSPYFEARPQSRHKLLCGGLRCIPSPFQRNLQLHTLHYKKQIQRTLAHKTQQTNDPPWDFSTPGNGSHSNKTSGISEGHGGAIRKLHEPQRSWKTIVSDLQGRWHTSQTHR